MATTVVTKSSIISAGGNTAVASGAAPGPVGATFSTTSTQYAIISGYNIQGASSPTGILYISGLGNMTVPFGMTLPPGGIYIPPSTVVLLEAVGGSGAISSAIMYVLFTNS